MCTVNHSIKSKASIQTKNRISLCWRGRNLCLYFFNTCKEASQGDVLSAQGIVMPQHQPLSKCQKHHVFTPATEVSHQHNAPFISVHQATVRCLKLQEGRMSCWFNVWVVVLKVDHSYWARSHLLSVSRRLPCIFKASAVGKTYLFILMTTRLMSLFSVM